MLKWFLNGEPIPTGKFQFLEDFQIIRSFFFSLDDHFEIQAKGPVHSLTIRKAAWNDGGEYKCLADGGAKTSATLVVKGKRSHTHCILLIKIFLSALPVTFTKPLEELTCNIGDTVEFVCETSKPCRVEWFFGDKRLSSQQYEIQTIDNKHTLRIPKAKLNDKGWYKCSIQDAFTEAKLIVIGKIIQLNKEKKIFLRESFR